MPGNRSLQLNRTRRSNSLEPVTGSQDSPQTPPVGYEDCERIEHQEASAGAAPELDVMGALLWVRRKASFRQFAAVLLGGTRCRVMHRLGGSWSTRTRATGLRGSAEPYGVVRVRIPAARGKETDMPNIYDQDLYASHGLCYESGTDEKRVWWFDVGQLCGHPEWHVY